MTVFSSSVIIQILFVAFNDANIIIMKMQKL